jgi:hypothetical protein
MLDNDPGRGNKLSAIRIFKNCPIVSRENPLYDCRNRLIDNKPWRLLAVSQRQRFDSSAINMALVAFSSLTELEQRSFISSLNIFLLSSSPQKRHFIEQWKSEVEK